MGSTSTGDRLIQWKTKTLDLSLAIDCDNSISIRTLSPSGVTPYDDPQIKGKETDIPLTSIRFPGDGNTATANKSAKSLIGSYASKRLQFQNYETLSCVDHEELIVRCEDPVTCALVLTHFVVYASAPVLQTFVEVQNQSSTNLILTQLSSLSIGGLTRSSGEWYDEYTLLTGVNGWFREAQWREQSLTDIGIDTNGILELGDGHNGSQATYGLSNRGSFSTGSHLPMGILKRKDDKDTWFWQIEHNGSWRWEIGDFKDSIYLAAGGPTGADHDCRIMLKPGQTFKSVPVACGRVCGGIDSAFGALTTYRRAIRRPHQDNETMPIIFNDYMNCLMGDPDENKIISLLDPVKRSGADYFVIDAGWYADDSNWWDDVGLWEPSKKRFPSGFSKLLDHIRQLGLIPGLWIEPEVVGVRSVIAKTLPEDAFFHEAGSRVIEKGRYQLDYRHPKVIEWMDSVFDRLITEYGAKYFKFDYNIEVVTGTDTNTFSPGAAHLEHQRAYLSWVRRLLDRYPGLVIENCSSGAQRMEYAMLSVHPIQSTSDQQDPLLYAAIAAAVPTAVAPEQSATWVYPQKQWDDEINAMTVLNSLLGRIHLSGRLDQINELQTALVTEGMQVYKNIRNNLRHALPIWPLGLPKWHDEWLSLGMICKDGSIYLAVWRRAGPTEARLPLRMFQARQQVQVTLLYPSKFDAKFEWQPEDTSLHVQLPDKACARLFELRSFVIA